MDRVLKQYWVENKGYLDFTKDSWLYYGAHDQIRYARMYQEWYAKNFGLPKQKDLVIKGKYGQSTSIQLLLIPPGKFNMGSKTSEIGRQLNEILHKVTISKPFYMGKYPVTQDQWQKITGTNPSSYKSVGISAPVEKLSWQDSKNFCGQNNVFLPTEAEWEYACRAGTTTPFNLGPNISTNQVNYNGNYPYGSHPKGINRGKTSIVGSLYNDNAFGLCDMHGNVWEWCEDNCEWQGSGIKTNTYIDEIVDPLNTKGSYHVYRGGGYYCVASYCRSAIRSDITANTPQEFNYSFGIRIITPASSGFNPVVNVDNFSNEKITIQGSDTYFENNLLKECWDEIKGYFDFTKPIWQNLRVEDQVKYSNMYQKWYAKKFSLISEKTTKANSAKFDLVLVPPGRFYMGAQIGEGYKNNENRHRVTISKPFYMCKYPITQKQWLDVTGSNPAYFKTCGLNSPIESVTWQDCKNFSTKIGFNLPTEAEWEYACRAGTTTAFNLGDNINADNVNYCGTYPYKNGPKGIYRDKVSPVGSLRNANAFGIYDMHGNVWEWCEDCCDWTGGNLSTDTYVDGIVDPVCRKGTHHVYRGGSYYCIASYCRSAIRGDVSADKTSKLYYAFGVRLTLPVSSVSSIPSIPTRKAQNSSPEGAEDKYEKKSTSPYIPPVPPVPPIPLSPFTPNKMSYSSNIVKDLWIDYKGYFDFTDSRWRTLPFKDQFQYAKEYQEWYSKEFGYQIEKDLPLGYGVNIKLVLVPPGKFYMGSDMNEKSRQRNEMHHRVIITKPFYLGKYPVTQKEWQTVMYTNPAKYKGEEFPIETIKHKDGMDFCNILKLRLPTEAEWEYACRAGTTTAFNLGTDINPSIVNFCEHKNVTGLGYSRTTKVGSLENANAFGLYDMHGNVWEWCQDKCSWASNLIKTNTYIDEITDPVEQNGTHYIYRGGSFYCISSYCRSALRSDISANTPDKFYYSFGIRVVSEAY